MRPFIQQRQLNLFLTPPHECSYLPEQLATTVFVDPYIQKTQRLYTLLSSQGFRRSGDHLYRPHCEGCQACLSTRIPVYEFEMRRNQKRIWQRNQDLIIKPVAPVYKPEHFRLYYNYISQRHYGGGMDDATPERYLQFLTSHWADTIFYEFRLEKQLLAVAVVDVLATGLSAVYTFFDPAFEKRGLGTFAVLWEIEEVKRLGLEWLYLGYWIENCRKMNYKSNYQPLEYYSNFQWVRTLITT